MLQFVAKRVRIDLPPDVADKIVKDSEGNLRKAILVFEALKMQSSVLRLHILASGTHSWLFRPDLRGNIQIAKPDWETYCHKVADLIVQEQSPARVMEVRAKFYELLSHCIPPTVILKVSQSNRRPPIKSYVLCLDCCRPRGGAGRRKPQN